MNKKNIKRLVCGLIVAIALVACVTKFQGGSVNVLCTDPPVIKPN